MDYSLPVPLSMEFSQQEYWNGLPFTSPGDLSNPGIEPGSPALQADSLLSELPDVYTHIYILYMNIIYMYIFYVIYVRVHTHTRIYIFRRED